MKTLFSSLSNNNNTHYIFQEAPSSAGAETASSTPKGTENNENINNDALKLVSSIADLPPNNGNVVKTKITGLIPGADYGGKILAAEAEKAITLPNNTGRNNDSVDPDVEWTGDPHTKKGDITVDTSLTLNKIPTSSVGKELAEPQ